MADSKRYLGAESRRLAREYGCVFGCSAAEAPCGTTWAHVVFKCKCPRMQERRVEWREQLEELQGVVGKRVPSSQLVLAREVAQHIGIHLRETATQVTRPLSPLVARLRPLAATG